MYPWRANVIFLHLWGTLSDRNMTKPIPSSSPESCGCSSCRLRPSRHLGGRCCSAELWPLPSPGCWPSIPSGPLLLHTTATQTHALIKIEKSKTHSFPQKRCLTNTMLSTSCTSNLDSTAKQHFSGCKHQRSKDYGNINIPR